MTLGRDSETSGLVVAEEIHGRYLPGATQTGNKVPFPLKDGSEVRRLSRRKKETESLKWKLGNKKSNYRSVSDWKHLTVSIFFYFWTNTWWLRYLTYERIYTPFILSRSKKKNNKENLTLMFRGRNSYSSLRIFLKRKIKGTEVKNKDLILNIVFCKGYQTSIKIFRLPPESFLPFMRQ